MRRIELHPVYLNATVTEGRGTVAQAWSGPHKPDMRHVERHAREIAAIPEIMAAARDLISRLDGEDVLNPRQKVAMRKLARALRKGSMP